MQTVGKRPSVFVEGLSPSLCVDQANSQSHVRGLDPAFRRCHGESKLRFLTASGSLRKVGSCGAKGLMGSPESSALERGLRVLGWVLQPSRLAQNRSRDFDGLLRGGSEGKGTLKSAHEIWHTPGGPSLLAGGIWTNCRKTGAALLGAEDTCQRCRLCVLTPQNTGCGNALRTTGSQKPWREL